MKIIITFFACWFAFYIFAAFIAALMSGVSFESALQIPMVWQIAGVFGWIPAVCCCAAEEDKKHCD